ncbi:MAG: AAA family ATPase [Candidatus Methanomethylophilaceae archaeon]
MTIRRKMLRDLEEWRGREHKSLLIDGPRGVGKTTLVREFARSEGSEILEVDISRNAEARRLFQSHHEPDDIVSGLEDITGQEVDGNTLILLDEVQDCPRAHQSLK